MKKFLSLLLALTLVLSLVVVPARADGVQVGGTYTITKTAGSLKRGDTTTFTVTATSPTVTDGSLTGSDVSVIGYSWNTPNFDGAAGTRSTTGTLTASSKVESMKVSCDLLIQYKVTVDDQQVTRTTTQRVESEAFGIADKLLPSDITSVTFNERTYTAHNGKVDIVLAADESIDNQKNKWAATAKNSYDVEAIYSSGLVVKVKDSSSDDLKVNMTVTPTPASVTASASLDKVLVGGTTKLSAESNLSSNAKYEWYAKIGSANAIPIGIGKEFNWTPNISAATHYSVTCKATDGSIIMESAAIPVSFVAGDYKISLNPSQLVMTSLNQAEPFTATLQQKSGSKYENVSGTITYKFASSNTSIATVSTPSNTTGIATVTLKGSGTAYITVTTTVKGKDIKAQLNVYGSPLEAQLSSVQSGSYRDYSYSELVSAAQTAINTRNRTLHGNQYVETVTQVNVSPQTTTYGTLTVSNNRNNYRFQANARNALGTAKVTGTVTTTLDNYTITFNIPVSPAKVTYADQYPEPVLSGNTYRYYVDVPSGYQYYYVVGGLNQSTEPNWSLSGTRYSSSNRYYLTDTNFVGGKCTLWLVTVDSSGAYSCGQLTVYQKNYNINYNGVAGETVQFAQSDFTDFMNEVAEARGDASKTKSYPYVTFDYVTFSLPTTAQGTLYYGGTAMSTSNSSGAFNTRTKVTNLDSVTFVPNAKTSAKTITLNFTLYATRYSSSSTSHGTTVPYSGSVVINLVREDIKYTVSQGDSVRFDESDFLSYLRSTKGYSSNYTIDYVTFDQSAVSAVNEGSLYTYYNGYNYGGSVKTTDKFYYSATASQNALSDVAFLASRYAKTGETVYIPFTIYARYGTTGTGTRQLTGTVAIKIGQTMNFIDVKTTDYFYNSVKWAVGKNITNGTSSTTFSPYKSCTRAEIVTFLWRAAGSPEPTITRNPFRDVNAVTHSSYYKAILWASQKGITSGTSATAFSPDQVCTRAQIVTFLYRYAGKPSGYYSNPFKDVGATSEASYYNAILWAVGKGITTGTSATTFSPYASCNRAEAVTFLYRYTNGL